MMEIGSQGWLTSVPASWVLVSVADAVTHGVMLALLVAAAFWRMRFAAVFVENCSSFGETHESYVGRCGIQP